MMSYYGCIETNAYIGLRRKVPFYISISKFVDDHTGFSDLVLSNFKTIFLLYFAICLAILCVCLLQNSANYLKNYLVPNCFNLTAWFLLVWKNNNIEQH